jgi:hypothetical protein
MNEPELIKITDKRYEKDPYHKFGLFKCGFCGKEFEVVIKSVKNKLTQSCGCLQKRVTTKHGLHKSSEYAIWHAIKQRCYNKDADHYEDYGGRGIQMCDRWLESFMNFYEDMGPRPNKSLSIDRLDNSGNYEKSNCEWRTKKEQSNNTRRNHILEHNGEKKTISEWARYLNISKRTILARLRYGWSIERTLTEQVKYKKKKNNAS